MSWSKVQLGEGDGRHPGGHPHQPGRQGQAVVGPEVELQDEDLGDGDGGGDHQGEAVVHTSIPTLELTLGHVIIWSYACRVCHNVTMSRNFNLVNYCHVMSRG